MRKRTSVVLGDEYSLPEPETFDDIRSMCMCESDVLELAVHGLRQKMITAIRQKSLMGRSPDEIQRHMDEWKFHQRLSERMERLEAADSPDRGGE